MTSLDKKIAINTILLYFRMLIVMSASLYASRVIIDVLGAYDYGLYNVVGGVVAMMGFLNSSISAGTSRFITYELGKGNLEKLKDVFNISLVSHIAIALLVFIIAETFGLWFVNTQMVFDSDRFLAVNIVYQMTIFTAILQFIQMPYSADIIAHENMSIYAYISILEVGLKLFMAFILQTISDIDYLIVYSILVFFVQLIILLIFQIYCTKMYPESKWRFVRDISRYKRIFSFAGWDVIGGLCVLSQGQVVNILLNIYFGPVVNAARAISYQVQGVFSQFTSNFMTAVNPEIVKSYARKDFISMIRLINNASLYSFYLLLIFLMPAMFKMEVLLNLWLKEVPDNTLIFSQIILALMFVRALARPIIVGTHATGDIKALNLYAGILGLLPLPLSWILLHFGASAITVYWIIALWGVLANIAEIAIFKLKVKMFSVTNHFISVYLRALIVIILATIPVYFINRLFESTFLSFCIYYVCALFLTCVVIFTVGLSKSIRIKIIKKIKHAIFEIKQWGSYA